jgi:excisionase family DNA binding protein
MNQPKPSNRKPPPRYASLDGRLPSKPRGRHAVARSETSSDADAEPRAILTVPVNRRLGFRVGEYANLLGISYTTVWRHVRDGKIKTIVVGGVKLIPRAFAIEQGLIRDNDTI